MKKQKKIKTLTSLDNDILMLKRIYQFLNDSLAGKNPNQDFDIEVKDGNIVDKPTKSTKAKTKNKDAEEMFNYKMAAHDLLSPLTNQATLLDMLKEEVDKALEYIEFLTLSNSESLKISKAALKNNDTKDINQPIFFKQLIDDVIQLLGIKKLHKDIKVVININHKKEFYNNTTIVQSIILNLMQNAVKYKKPDQQNTITISITDINKGIKIIVQDTGIGMSKQRLQKLFNQPVLSDTTVKDSHGFGLYGVAQYVETLNGKITAESNLKIGSSFTVELPTLFYRKN